VVTELKLSARFLTKATRPRARRAALAAGTGQKAAPAGETYWLDVFAAEQAVRRAKRMRLLGFAAILLTVAAAGLLAGKLFFARRVPGPVLKFIVSAEAKSSSPGGVTISPDGRYVVFSADGPEGHRMLWMRALDETHARIVPGTEDAAEPFWSADSHAIGYFAGRSLKIWKLQVDTDGSFTGEPRFFVPPITWRARDMECGRRDRLLAQPQRRSLPHFRKRRRSAGPIAAECGQRASLVPLAPLPARRQALHFSRARRGRQNQRSLLGRSRNQG